MTSNVLDFNGVFDIECADWDRFLVGGALGRDGEYYESWDEDSFADYMLSREGVWYAHAGGRYDAIWLLDIATRRKMDWSARMRGAGLLSVRVGNVEVRDSIAIVPMSLKDAAGMAGKRKTSTGLPCECGSACGGYCALSRCLAPGERALVSDYLRNDCEVLASVLQAVSDRALHEGIALRLTMGGSAWATAKAWLDLPSCTHDLGRYTRIRRGYYGGRTEVFKPRASSGDRYDIHSSYPAALSRVALPEGNGTTVRGNTLASAHYMRGHDGVYTCDVIVPESYIPPLPWRTEERLLYPYGKVSGTWTGLELRHAESCGVKILGFSSADVWPTSRPILAPYAERVWQLRAEAVERGEIAVGAWYKFLANSLTGKLAQRPEQSSLDFVEAIGGEPPELDSDTEIVATYEHGAFVTHKTTRVGACAHVQWAAQLTAEARTELHRQLIEAGESALYCDTDSVYSAKPLTRRIGPNLGEWGHEGSMSDWESLAPKIYRYTCDGCKKHPDGGAHVRGKGMPGLDSAGFDRLKKGAAWKSTRGVEGIRTQIRKKDTRLFKRRELKRALHPEEGWIGGRELDGNGTRPTTIERYSKRGG